MLLDLKKEEIVSITRPQLLIYDNLVQSYRWNCKLEIFECFSNGGPLEHEFFPGYFP